jgi:hypothetical protein
MQNPFNTADIVSVLRNTLRRLEQSGAFKQDDAALIHLKRQIVLAIAELEMQKDLKCALEPTKPVVLIRVRKPAAPDCSPVLELCSNHQ